MEILKRSFSNGKCDVNTVLTHLMQTPAYIKSTVHLRGLNHLQITCLSSRALQETNLKESIKLLVFQLKKKKSTAHLRISR